jgi:undecaprenyl-diphosphatase
MSAGSALLLGVVQGLTEFLPVSSSGHLVIVRRLLGWVDEGLFFDAVLHLGTFLAVVVYFRRVVVRLLTGQDRPLVWALLVGTVPAAVVGLAGERWLAQYARGVASIGISFLVTAAVLVAAEAVARRRRPRDDVPTRIVAGIVGMAQACALVPGLSRSGLTMAAGLACGLTRRRAVEFSFLLALPITAVAGLEGVRALTDADGFPLLPLALGVSAAFLSGLASIAVLVRSAQRYSLVGYAVYLVVAGLAVVRWL